MVVRGALISLVALSAGVVTAYPQQAAPAEDKPSRMAQAADFFDIDLFSPSGPALIALGVSAQNVADPGVFKDFALEFDTVNNGERNNFGLAITTVPYWWGHRDLTLDEYRTETSAFERIGARTQISFGVAQAGGENTEALRLGFGVQAQLLDRQDHKFDLESVTCIHDAWDTFRRPAALRAAQKIAEAIASGKDLSQADMERIQEDTLNANSDEAFLSSREACQDQAAGRLLAQRSLKIGGGFGFRSEETSGLGNFEYDGVSLWAAVRQPIDAQGRFAVLGFVRGDIDRVFDLDNDLRSDGDGIALGLGLAYQTPRFRIDLSADYNVRDYTAPGFDTDDFLRYTATADVRLAEGVWIELSGGFIDGSDYQEGAFGGVSLKIAWGDFFPFF